YKAFQLDFEGANSQLEDLKAQAFAELSKLGGIGKGVFAARVAPAIGAAQTQIAAIEAERQRRGALVFGPPQFHSGGLVGGHLRAGETLAVLRRGEFVVNEQATRKNLSELLRINSGGAASGDSYHVTINAVDAKSFQQMLATGGIRVIKRALRTDLMEGGVGV
ncbi:MAG: hypothetical protein ACRD2R_00110, partial [Terriglobales bacterium]